MVHLSSYLYLVRFTWRSDLPPQIEDANRPLDTAEKTNGEGLALVRAGNRS